MLDKIEIIKQVEKKIKNNDFKGALGEVTKCLELYPNFLVAKVLKAECLLNLNSLEEALALVNEVLFSAPDNIKARKIAVEANLRLGNLDEAKSHIDFLGFLLPANHAYLEEVKKRVIELESLQEMEEETPEFEIERTGVEEGQKEVSISQDSENAVETEKPVAQMEDDNFEENKTKEEHQEVLLEESGVGEDDFLIDSKDLDTSQSQDGVVESGEEKYNEVEEVNEDKMVTGVLQEQISTVTLPEKKEEPEIKTRTLALIYERQGMFQEALEILEKLFEESQDVDLLKDIERIKTKLKGGEKSDYIVKKIKLLEGWLERVKWHSSN